MWGNRLSLRCQIHGGENSTSRTATCLVLGASEKCKRSSFWGTQFGLGQGTQAGQTSVPHIILPPPQHLSMGPTACGDHGQHKVSGSHRRAASPQSFRSLDPSLWSNISFNSLGPLITMATASHEKQPELFPERQGVTSAASPWENPSGAPIIISWQGWGAWQQVTQHPK